MKIYVIYDKKAEKDYGLFDAANDEHALRKFENTALSNEHFVRYMSDMVLYRVGDIEYTEHKPCFVSNVYEVNTRTTMESIGGKP